MKSRYKDFVNKQQRDVFSRKADEMQKGYAILYEKLLIYTLHTVFGFGVKRISAVFNAMGGMVDEMHNSPVFWDNVDKIVIDKLGFDYKRCNCEYLEKAFYRPPVIPAEEKRAAVADMRRMKEYLSREKDDKIG